MHMLISMNADHREQANKVFNAIFACILPMTANHEINCAFKLLYE